MIVKYKWFFFQSVNVVTGPLKQAEVAPKDEANEATKRYEKLF